MGSHRSDELPSADGGGVRQETDLGEYRRPGVQLEVDVEPVRSDGRLLVIRTVCVAEQPAVELGLVVQVAQHALAHLLRIVVVVVEGPEELALTALAARGLDEAHH